MAEPLVTMTRIVKRFGGSQVVCDADLALRPGCVHALIGPNGAGKSTMIKILSGVYRADAGSVHTRQRNGTSKARIGFIHQNLGLVEGLSVRENIFLSRSVDSSIPGLIAAKPEREAATASLSAVRSSIDPETPLLELGLGQQTLVALARLRRLDIDVMVLDETSAALTRRESEWLYSEAKRFADAGGAVLVVTHRLAEVTAFCDEATVMRDGKVVFTGPVPSLHEIHELMVAGADEDPPAIRSFDGEDRVVHLAGACSDRVGPVDLDVHAGEVVALVGPLSANLYDIGHLVAGHTRKTLGRVEVEGPVAFLPENCQAQALLPGLSVRENIAVGSLRQFLRRGALSARAEARAVRERMSELDIAPPDPDAAVELLSGGNQQKVMLARATLSRPKCYVLCEPTRGVDIKTRHAIYRFIRAATAASAAVVVITIDVDDAFAVAHRIGVVKAGGVVDSVDPRGAKSKDTILEEVDS